MGKKPAQRGERARSHKHPRFWSVGVRPGGLQGQGARQQYLFQVGSDSEVQGMRPEAEMGSFTPFLGLPKAQRC